MLTEGELNAISRRVENATPGPWFPAATDDDVAMSACYVTTTPCRFEHDNKFGMAPGTADFDNVICVTLLQHPRLACHKSDKWDENTEFIAHAREDVPALVETTRALMVDNGELKSLCGMMNMKIEKLELLLKVIARHPSVLNLPIRDMDNKTTGSLILSDKIDDISNLLFLLEQQ